MLAPSLKFCFVGVDIESNITQKPIGVTRMHLLLNSGQYKDFAQYIGAEITVNGIVVAGHTGHHRSNVLLDARGLGVTAQHRLINKENTANRTQVDLVRSDQIASTRVLEWKPKIDFDAVFPAYILANANRKQPISLPPNYFGDPFGLVGILVFAKERNTKLVLSVAINQFAETTTEEFFLWSLDNIVYTRASGTTTNC